MHQYEFVHSIFPSARRIPQPHFLVQISMISSYVSVFFTILLRPPVPVCNRFFWRVCGFCHSTAFFAFTPQHIPFFNVDVNISTCFRVNLWIFKSIVLQYSNSSAEWAFLYFIKIFVIVPSVIYIFNSFHSPILSSAPTHSPGTSLSPQHLPSVISHSPSSASRYARFAV